MECTIGWIKTKEGFILFKNRDRKKEESKANFFFKDENIITFEDKNFKGCWIGINKHGLGIASSSGPCRDIPEGFHCENENFELNKIVLQKAKSVEEATKIYIRLLQEQKIGKSFNVIICDKNHANILELILDKSNIQTIQDSVFRTNNFETMKRFNTVPERTKQSLMRLNKVLELVENVKESKEIIPILSFHSEDNNENICRHNNNITVASTIFEVKADEIIIYSLLNKSPCEGKYKREALRF